MKGAIFYGTKYGSTAEYANWIAEATGLPVFDMKSKKVDLSSYDFFILGSPIIYYKIFNRKWLRKNWMTIKNKPIILFSVSGAGSGSKLDGWIANSGLPEDFVSKISHVALRGRQIPKELTWYDRIMLIIGAMKNPDPVASKEELHGFDYMDKSTIEPILQLAQQFQAKDELITSEVHN